MLLLFLFVACYQFSILFFPSRFSGKHLSMNFPFLTKLSYSRCLNWSVCAHSLVLLHLHLKQSCPSGGVKLQPLGSHTAALSLLWLVKQLGSSGSLSLWLLPSSPPSLPKSVERFSKMQPTVLGSPWHLWGRCRRRSLLPGSLGWGETPVHAIHQGEG